MICNVDYCAYFSNYSANPLTSYTGMHMQPEHRVTIKQPVNFAWLLLVRWSSTRTARRRLIIATLPLIIVPLFLVLSHSVGGFEVAEIITDTIDVEWLLHTIGVIKHVHQARRYFATALITYEIELLIGFAVFIWRSTTIRTPLFRRSPRLLPLTCRIHGERWQWQSIYES